MRAVEEAGRMGSCIGAQHRTGNLGAIVGVCGVDRDLVGIVDNGGEMVDVSGLVKFEVVSAGKL